MSASTSDAPSSGTQLRLRPPRHRVERRAIAHWTVRAALTAVPIAAVAVIGATVAHLALPEQDWTGWLWVLAVVVALPPLLTMVIMPQWRYRVHRWEVTDDAVYTLAGWLWQEWRVAPMSRIQTVDTHRGPLQRAFGLSTVTVTTASAAGALSIDGLDTERATRVAEELTEVTQAIPGDAT